MELQALRLRQLRGDSGGLRAVQMEKLLVTTLKMMPMVEGVTAPMAAQRLDESGNFISNERIDASAKTLLDELLRWVEGLKAMRARPVSRLHQQKSVTLAVDFGCALTHWLYSADP